MAIDLGITAGAYAKIERGETDPSISRLIQIAEILKVDITFFLKDSSAVPFLVEEPQLVYESFATKHDVENLAQLIKQLNKEVEKLKSQVAPAKKIVSKKKLNKRKL